MLPQGESGWVQAARRRLFVGVLQAVPPWRSPFLAQRLDVRRSGPFWGRVCRCGGSATAASWPWQAGASTLPVESLAVLARPDYLPANIRFGSALTSAVKGVVAHGSEPAPLKVISRRGKLRGRSVPATAAVRGRPCYQFPCVGRALQGRCVRQGRGDACGEELGYGMAATFQILATVHACRISLTSSLSATTFATFIMNFFPVSRRTKHSGAGGVNEKIG